MTQNSSYRPDIDGLRAIAVLAVIVFHTNPAWLPGGFIGVDVFFVISGFLITGIIAAELTSGSFSFGAFYRRRVVRLAPALIITLAFTLAFGLVFFSDRELDSLGKEIAFAAVGALNILYAQGSDYFLQDFAAQPLIHLWSLGVEEQFYLVWPFILFVVFRFGNRAAITLTLALAAASLWASVASLKSPDAASYYLPQYRAFELMIGALTALVVRNARMARALDRRVVGWMGAVLIVASLGLVSKSTPFPGLAALGPCIGTALVILGAGQGALGILLSWRPLVLIGLVSYPLYLYHQPLLVAIGRMLPPLDSGIRLALVLGVGIPLAWLTYRYVERPARSLGRRRLGWPPAPAFVALPIAAAALCSIGLFLAINGGLPQRFRLLNEYADRASRALEITFESRYAQGYQVRPPPEGRVLFVGDSLLQQYVLPFARALDLASTEFDSISRGGCVLLDQVQFRDEFAGISCEGLRERLQRNDKRYDIVVLSQSWDTYDRQVLNFDPVQDRAYRWQSLLSRTVAHYLTVADKVVVIGWHPVVRGFENVRVNLLTRQTDFESRLADLEITNDAAMARARPFFDSLMADKRVIALHPQDIFSAPGGCHTSDGRFPYFSDSRHINEASTACVTRRIEGLLDQNGVTRMNSIAASAANR